MKINILDAGLYEKAGHHFDHNRSLAKHLAELGHEVSIYGSVGMREDTVESLREFGAVRKLLRAPHYGDPAKFDSVAGDLAMFDYQASVTTEDLQSVGKADLWLWPSLRANQLYACAQAGHGIPVVGCIHEDPGIEERSIAAKLWRLAYLTAHRLGLPHCTGSVEIELRHRFMEIVPDKRFVVFPHPYSATPIAEPKSALKKIGVFGHHRSDKGIKLLGPLLMQLAQDGYQILFQDSAGLRKDLPHPNIELLGFVEDISVPISSCDLVVLPYDVAGYATKGSGILATCMMLGVPVVGPLGTIPGRTIEQFQVGPLFAATRAESIYGAVKMADKHFGVFAKRAFEVSRQYSRQNGVANYVNTVMGGVSDIKAIQASSTRKAAQRRAAESTANRKS